MSKEKRVVYDAGEDERERRREEKGAVFEHTEELDHFEPLSNEENMKDIVVPEEFPDGPFGSPIRKEAPVERKSTKWREGQRSISAYTYADKDRHDDLPRQMPGAHPLHDE